MPVSPRASVTVGTTRLPLRRVHTLVVGSGAAGLNAAVQLHRHGVSDILIVTEGLDQGTSINTGSDKQTYYKLGLYGTEPDAPALMAESYVQAGSMHGDLALVEAACSARCFLNLVNLGVPFPHDRYGQYVGYKTDHDPRQRATSIGPYTSREMCRALIREVHALRIPVLEQRRVVALVNVPDRDGFRAAGAIAVTASGRFEAFAADNVIYAVGGPGGLYKASVYPECHTGAIGTALLAGALAQNLPESQFGLASIRFRWNVSGTYMQVIPRFISTAPDGHSDEKEFLLEAFSNPSEMHSLVFLKGYQWPFDSRKLNGGSSVIDILVYIETVLRGRRVFLDFRRNPTGFSLDALSPEARGYLERSGAFQETPLARLAHMNPAAIALYREHGIALDREPLEIALCAQHQNGGLAGTIWWESLNIPHLFPIGEVNGSHGVARPGGSALNAGQVGGLRAALRIAHVYREPTLRLTDFRTAAIAAVRSLGQWLEKGKDPGALDDGQERAALQERMSRAGAAIRSLPELEKAVTEAESQWERIEQYGLKGRGQAAYDRLTTRQLVFAHLVILDAIRYGVSTGVGSRGSALVLDPNGPLADPRLGPEWRYAPEDPRFRERVLETAVQGHRREHRWVPRRPIPPSDAWFETTWGEYREGRLFRD